MLNLTFIPFSKNAKFDKYFHQHSKWQGMNGLRKLAFGSHEKLWKKQDNVQWGPLAILRQVGLTHVGAILPINPTPQPKRLEKRDRFR